MEIKWELTPELLEKAESAPNAAALLALAPESGTTLTMEEAEEYYAVLRPETGSLSDEELNHVTGGAKTPGYKYNRCKNDWRCNWCSVDMRPHSKGSFSCSQRTFDCTTCKNFKNKRCTVNTHI